MVHLLEGVILFLPFYMLVLLPLGALVAKIAGKKYPTGFLIELAGLYLTLLVLGLGIGMCVSGDMFGGLLILFGFVLTLAFVVRVDDRL